MIKDELRIYMKRLGLAFRETEAKAVVSGLPLYISAAYDWVRAELDGRRMLLAVAKQRDVDPAEVVSMWAVMRKALGESVVLVLPPEGEDYCLALVKGGMNFIMPGARMRLQGGKEIVTKRNTGYAYAPQGRMSIAAQQIVLWYLLKGRDGRIPFVELTDGLGILKSQVSMAATELERLNLARIDRAWKSHGLVFDVSKADVWNKSLPLMATPVLRRMRMCEVPKGLPHAGILALSEMSMLESDAVGTYAISRRDKRVKGLEGSRYEGDYVQIWKYDPAKFSSVPDRVDPLSLYLSLKDDPDPRVQGELKAVMGEMKW